MSDKNILIVIPARYHSTRLPGKPLVKIKGVEMIRRVAQIAAFISKNNDNCAYCVATDDARIESFCKEQNIPVVMTSENCKSGTERCHEAASKTKPAFVVNLQGDNPLCPPHIIQQLIDAWKSQGGDVFTPCIRLSWDNTTALSNPKKRRPRRAQACLSTRTVTQWRFPKTSCR